MTSAGFDVTTLEKLTDKEFNTVRDSLEIDIRQLETENTRVTTLLDLMNKKEELLSEIIAGYSRIRSGNNSNIKMMISTRVDNVIIEES